MENKDIKHTFSLVSIEGDIGAGKTTLIDLLKKERPTWHFIDEPVGTWQSLKTAEGENLLQLFYKDQTRYSYTFQNCALLSRALKIKETIDTVMKRRDPKCSEHHIFVTERCLETDFYVFAQMLHDDGRMNLVEWDLYQMWYNYVKGQSPSLNKIVYVSTPPTICKERIGLRGREGEENIPLEYLKSLDVYQRRWLYNFNAVPVLDYKNYGDSPMPWSDVARFIEG
jgi:deoxycitidine kinase